MPYTPEKAREPYQELLQPIFKFIDLYQISAGDLNLVLTRIILKYFISQKCYQTACNIDGVLNNISKEFYARVVRPYEELKIKQNGDVLEYQEIIDWIIEEEKNLRTFRKLRLKK